MKIFSTNKALTIKPSSQKSDLKSELPSSKNKLNSKSFQELFNLGKSESRPITRLNASIGERCATGTSRSESRPITRMNATIGDRCATETSRRK